IVHKDLDGFTLGQQRTGSEDAGDVLAVEAGQMAHTAMDGTLHHDRRAVTVGAGMDAGRTELLQRVGLVAPRAAANLLVTGDNGMAVSQHGCDADLLTVQETFGSLKDVTVAYVGDGRNNVANSLMMGCAKAGVRYVCCAPASLRPDEAVLAEAEEVAKKNGVDIRVSEDPVKGVKGANVLYTDVWVSMGEEDKTAERIKLLKPYQINMDLMRATGNIDGKLMFLHCLPAFHDFNTDVTKECGALEVTDEVFESKYSKVFDESENRMHTIKALFVSALCDRASI
ncbi:MAG: hypothetical protein E7046_02840, partial [Lentisphaerae bacterium]|nr:hypothetical protein [Lentisphaerota bacterium]